MRRLLLVLPLAGLLASGPAAAAPMPREGTLYRDAPSGMYLLERGWTTRADPRDAGRREGWQREGMRAGFRRVSVPDAFNAGELTRRGERSRAQWYRLRFELPRGAGATGWKLRFESVANRAEVFLNGRRLGLHEGAHLPFELAARGVRRGANELVVRVDGRESASDLPPAGRPRGWWNYGGLLREVYLRRVGAFDLADLQIQAEPGQPASVTVRAVARNTTRRAQRLALRLEASGPGGFALAEPRDFGNVPAGRLGRVETSFAIPSAALWSPQSPALYSLRLTLPGGQVTRASFGVRRWSIDRQSGTALLNGRPLSLRGASFHEHDPRLGAALRAPQLDQISESLLALAADFTRQHYPPHPRLLEAFDRLGIALWEQIPVWRLRGTHLRSRRLRREALSRLRQAILRDRNHASVMTWSVGNELLRGGSAEERYLREARRVVDRLDPTRFLGIDKSISPLDQVPDHYRLLDVLGLSAYIGWYGKRPTSELRAALDAIHARFPGLGLFLTEFGAEASRAGSASEKGTYAFQTRFLQDYLDIVDSTPYLNGAAVWLLRDFAVRPGWAGGNPRPDPPYNRKGLIDERGRRKPAFTVVHDRLAAVPPTR